MSDTRPTRITRARAATRAALTASLTAVAWLIGTTTAFAASPSPGAAGDPRSSGQGPGLVGDPAFAVLAVVAIGLTAVVVTLVWVRLTTRRGT